MSAEILSVGTELLLGRVVNTDTTAIARVLSVLGIDMLRTEVVGDNDARLFETVRAALERSTLLITTGGLGPTGDDITKETVARAAGVPLEMHEPSLRTIEAQFKGRVMDENQKKQAMLPRGCTVFANHHGTAPGCAFTADTGCEVIMLPGPPSELVPMLEESVRPYLAGKSGAVIVTHDMHVYGQGEGHVAALIDDLMNGANPTVATYAKDGEMFVRVAAKAADRETADALCAPVMEEVRRRVGSEYIYAVDIETLEETVVRKLLARGMKIATAESCTGGLLAKRITDVAGSSEVFEMGAVTYANRIKEQVLGVSAQTLEKYGAVSPETAREMAESIRKAAGSDIGIGITGIAGPGGGSAEKPVGLVYIAMSTAEKTVVCRKSTGSRVRSREWNRHTSASCALDLVRRELDGLPLPEGVVN